MAQKVVTFGEIMLRLSPPGYQRFVQARSLDVIYGGGEANVAVALACFGLDSCFVTKVPQHEIGQSAVNYLRQFSVNTAYIKRGGDRLGIYFLEHGASQRASKVIYDRKHAAISEVGPGEFNWDEIMRGAAWFHFTGITPALGDGPIAAATEALEAAKRAGVKVSVDLNYRKNLWSPEKANKVMTQFMAYTNVAFCNEEDAEKVFGIKAGASDVTKAQLDAAGYDHVARELAGRFGLEMVAITLRESVSASDNFWSGMVYDGKDVYRARRYPVHIVDRVGGGDAFAAGLIYSTLSGKGPQDAVDFAAAASCLKHSIFGDFNLVTVAEVESLAKGDVSGRVQR